MRSLFLVFLLWALTTANAFAEQYTVKARALNIRKDTSLRAEKIGKLQQTDTIQLSAIKGSWGEVDLGIQGKGFVSLKYLELVPDHSFTGRALSFYHDHSSAIWMTFLLLISLFLPRAGNWIISKIDAKKPPRSSPFNQSHFIRLSPKFMGGEKMDFFTEKILGSFHYNWSLKGIVLLTTLISIPFCLIHLIFGEILFEYYPDYSLGSFLFLKSLVNDQILLPLTLMIISLYLIIGFFYILEALEQDFKWGLLKVIIFVCLIFPTIYCTLLGLFMVYLYFLGRFIYQGSNRIWQGIPGFLFNIKTSLSKSQKKSDPQGIDR